MAVNQKQVFGQKQGFEKRLVGIVSMVTGDTRAKMTLLEDGKTFANGTNSMTVNLEDLPSMPRVKANDKSGNQRYRVRMSGDGKEVEALTPVNGYFKARVIDLGPRPEKDADPMPKEKVWNEGKSNENRYLEFFAVYQIIEGAYKGVQLPAYQLHYKFQEDEGNPGFAGFTFSLSNKQATRGKQLAEWGHLHGVWEVQGQEVFGDPIPWDDETILPEILERVIDNDREVNLVIKDGYIKEVLPAEDAAGFEEEEQSESDAVDEMLDGPVEEVEIKSTASTSNGKVKPAPVTRPAKRVVKKSPAGDDDDL